jgi:Arm DNA-binding domain
MSAKRPPRKLRFTDIAVKNAKPEPAVYTMWDTKQHGLALRVQPTGGRAFYAVYSRQGRPRWQHLGNARDLGLAAARTIAIETMLEVARGRDPVAERHAQRSSGTFADLVQRYLDEHAKKNNRSWKQADALVRRFALPRCRRPRSPAPTSRPRWRRSRSMVAVQTIRHVSAIFAWGVREDLLSVNPCRAVARNVTSDTCARLLYTPIFGTVSRKATTSSRSGVASGCSRKNTSDPLARWSLIRPPAGDESSSPPRPPAIRRSAPISSTASTARRSGPLPSASDARDRDLQGGDARSAAPAAGCALARAPAA